MNTNICGCVVHAKPGTGTAVAEHLTALPGFEVHAVGEDDKLVVTVEDTADSLAADRLGALNGVTGVINAVLVYHTTAATTWSRCQPPERTSPGSTRHPAQTPEETAVPDTRPISRHDFIKSQAAIAAASVAGVTLPSSLLAKVQDETVDTGIRWDKAPCRFCGTGCSVLVGTRDGKVIASQGDPDAPVNRGLNCIKGYFLPKILYGQDRLTQPLLRKKEGRFAKDGNFEAVSWDEAFDVMAEHWKKALKRSMEENKGKSVDEMTSRVGMFGSGQWTVWEGYAASKLLKAGMRSNAERPRVRALVRCEPAGQQADAGCHRPAVEGDRLQEVRVQGGAGAGCGEPADRTVSRQEPMKHVQRA